ncbi:MAG: hypothetical protein KGL99_13220 [Burkholderiales bacterium]|nr:hypothetical protein [Burkholderiales bacterium]
MRTPSHCGALLLILTLLTTGTGHAADKPKKQGAFGTGKAVGAYLTRDQLRACMTQRDRATQVDADLKQEQAALADLKAQIASSGDALKLQLDVVDRASADAVAAYNEQAQARDKEIDAYQARVTAFNARVEARQAEREAYAKNCDNRRYFEEDEIAIKKGK